MCRSTIVNMVWKKYGDRNTIGTWRRAFEFVIDSTMIVWYNIIYKDSPNLHFIFEPYSETISLSSLQRNAMFRELKAESMQS